MYCPAYSVETDQSVTFPSLKDWQACEDSKIPFFQKSVDELLSSAIAGNKYILRIRTEGKNENKEECLSVMVHPDIQQQSWFLEYANEEHNTLTFTIDNESCKQDFLASMLVHQLTNSSVSVRNTCTLLYFSCLSLEFFYTVKQKWWKDFISSAKFHHLWFCLSWLQKLPNSQEVQLCMDQVQQHLCLQLPNVNWLFMVRQSSPWWFKVHVNRLDSLPKLLWSDYSSSLNSLSLSSSTNSSCASSTFLNSSSASSTSLHSSSASIPSASVSLHSSSASIPSASASLHSSSASIPSASSSSSSFKSAAASVSASLNSSSSTGSSSTSARSLLGSCDAFKKTDKTAWCRSACSKWIEVLKQNLCISNIVDHKGWSCNEWDKFLSQWSVSFGPFPKSTCIELVNNGLLKSLFMTNAKFKSSRRTDYDEDESDVEEEEKEKDADEDESDDDEDEYFDMGDAPLGNKPSEIQEESDAWEIYCITRRILKNHCLSAQETQNIFRLIIGQCLNNSLRTLVSCRRRIMFFWKAILQHSGNGFTIPNNVVEQLDELWDELEGDQNLSIYRLSVHTRRSDSQSTILFRIFMHLICSMLIRCPVKTPRFSSQWWNSWDQCYSLCSVIPKKFLECYWPEKKRKNGNKKKHRIEDDDELL